MVLFRSRNCGDAARRRVVAAECSCPSRSRMRGQDLGAGGGPDDLGFDRLVGVAVAGGAEVQVVAEPATAERHVQGLPVFGAVDEDVGGVDGGALGGVDGDRVGVVDVLADVVGGEPGDLAAALVPDPQPTPVADLEHGPPVTVLHEIGGRQPVAAVVAAGQQLVPDRGRQARCGG